MYSSQFIPTFPTGYTSRPTAQQILTQQQRRFDASLYQFPNQDNSSQTNPYIPLHQQQYAQQYLSLGQAQSSPQSQEGLINSNSNPTNNITHHSQYAFTTPILIAPPVYSTEMDDETSVSDQQTSTSQPQNQFSPLFNNPEQSHSQQELLRLRSQQDRDFVAPTSTTIPAETMEEIRYKKQLSFISNLSDINACFQTLLLPDRYQYILPQLSTTDRQLAKLIIQHSHHFVQFIPQDLRNQIIQKGAISTPSSLDHNPTSTTQLQHSQQQQQPQQQSFQNSKLFQLITSNRPIPVNQALYESTTAEVTWQYLMDLQPGKWLCMHLINGFFSLLLQRQETLRQQFTLQQNPLNITQSPPPSTTSSLSPTSTPNPTTPTPPLTSTNTALPTFFFLNTQFFSLLTDKRTNQLNYQYDIVRRWSLRAKIIVNNLDYLFVPCHVNGNHWTLLVADIKNRIISYYDSFHPLHDGGRCDVLRRYLYDEWLTYGGWNGYNDADRYHVKIVGTNPTPITSNPSATTTPPPPPHSFNLAQQSLAATTAQFRYPNRIGTEMTLSPTTSTKPFPNISNNTQQLDANMVQYNHFQKSAVYQIPHQDNMYDCGIFICAFANALVLGVNLGGVGLDDYHRAMGDNGSSQTDPQSSTTNHYDNSAPTPQQLYSRAELTTRLDQSQPGLRSQRNYILPFSQENMIDFRYMMVISFINGYLPIY